VEPSASEVVIPHVVSLTMDSTEDDELIKDVLALVSPPPPYWGREDREDKRLGQQRGCGAQHCQVRQVVQEVANASLGDRATLLANVRMRVFVHTPVSSGCRHCLLVRGNRASSPCQVSPALSGAAGAR
jgi:hypothetical protein